jgi:hypothetical protein
MTPLAWSLDFYFAYDKEVLKALNTFFTGTKYAHSYAAKSLNMDNKKALVALTTVIAESFKEIEPFKSLKFQANQGDGLSYEVNFERPFFDFSLRYTLNAANLAVLPAYASAQNYPQMAAGLDGDEASDALSQITELVLGDLLAQPPANLLKYDKSGAGIHGGGVHGFISLEESALRR